MTVVTLMTTLCLFNPLLPPFSMSNQELIDIVSMNPTFCGQPVAEVLRGFQVRVFKVSTPGYVQLSVDFCTQSLLTSPKLNAENADACIESLQTGLVFGHAATGYLKKGNMWMSQKENFA